MIMGASFFYQPREQTIQPSEPGEDSIAKRITVEGVFECLPHKNTSGPQTEECAFGLAGDRSDAHYALDFQLLSQGPIDYPTGTRVRIEGLFTPLMALSSDHWQKYPIDGIISVTSVQVLE